MLLDPAGARLHKRDGTDDLLAAFTAKALTRLHRCAASITQNMNPSLDGSPIALQILSTDDTQKT
jgi:hypothetical protein